MSAGKSYKALRWVSMVLELLLNALVCGFAEAGVLAEHISTSNLDVHLRHWRGRGQLLVIGLWKGRGEVSRRDAISFARRALLTLHIDVFHALSFPPSYAPVKLIYTCCSTWYTFCHFRPSASHAEKATF
ncbi:unnamed protein product [Peniophora sp. CBMAI 1063]|nr:unnamed protein product [Peniophora sp. CBMAI 1063]